MDSTHTARTALLKMYAAALNAVKGRESVRRALLQNPVSDPVTIVAVGKAAQSMAMGAHDVLGQGIHGGLVISKPGHLDPDVLAGLGLESVEGGHPIPTQGTLDAGRRLLRLIRNNESGRLLFLISGGASSLVEVPVAGLGLDDLKRAGEWLLGSGLDIESMNRVRISLSVIKGGGLLRRLQGLDVRALAVSDVPGDDPAVIGSGLLVPAPDLEDRVRALKLPQWLRDWVDRGLVERNGLPGDGPTVEIVASLDEAKAAAAAEAKRQGLPVTLHQVFIGGDAREEGTRLSRKLLEGPIGVQVWGGETTVVLPDQPGRGGRNQHLALSAAMILSGRRDCLFLSAGTDGTDGPTEDTGALVDGGTLERAGIEGFDPGLTLQRADSGTLLEATGDLIHTGPSGTNVMDLMLGIKIDERT